MHEPVVYSVDGIEIESDFSVQTVAELRQEIAAKLGQHVFSRTLFLDGEPLHNQRFAVAVNGRRFKLRK